MEIFPCSFPPIILNLSRWLLPCGLAATTEMITNIYTKAIWLKFPLAIGGYIVTNGEV